MASGWRRSPTGDAADDATRCAERQLATGDGQLPAAGTVAGAGGLLSDLTRRWRQPADQRSRSAARLARQPVRFQQIRTASRVDVAVGDDAPFVHDDGAGKSGRTSCRSWLATSIARSSARSATRERRARGRGLPRARPAPGFGVHRQNGDGDALLWPRLRWWTCARRPRSCRRGPGTATSSRTRPAAPCAAGQRPRRRRQSARRADRPGSEDHTDLAR